MTNSDNKKDLSLDQERLVRLQDAQLEAAQGGAAQADSNVVKVTTRGEAIEGDEDTSSSCCSKSC